MKKTVFVRKNKKANMKKSQENEEEQKALFKVKYGYNASELKMTAKDFAVQVCREIDLLMNM